MLRALPLCTCCHHYPGAAIGFTLAHSPSRISLPRNGGRVGLRNVLFEACSVFTHVTACTLALPPYFAARFTGGFNRFVTSTVAPVASGWSRLPGGIFTHWESAAVARRTPKAEIQHAKIGSQGKPNTFDDPRYPRALELTWQCHPCLWRSGNNVSVHVILKLV